MDNPFKQFLPDEEAPEAKIKVEVMSSIHLKSFLADMLELITAIFGLVLIDSISAGPNHTLNGEDEME